MMHFPPSLLPGSVTKDIKTADRVTLIDEFDVAAEPATIESPTRHSVRLRFDDVVDFSVGPGEIVYDAEARTGTLDSVVRTDDATTVRFEL